MKQPMNREIIIQYLLDMTKRMPNRYDDPYKWNRWLGFIQGNLFSLGLCTVDELKKENKNSLEESLSAAKTILEKELEDTGNKK